MSGSKAAMSHQAQMQNAQAANLQARKALLDSNQLQLTQLSSQTGSMGAAFRQNLNNTGITTGFFVDVTITLTNANTTAETLTQTSAGAGAVYAAVSNVNAKDYNQYNRFNATGYQSFLLSTERKANIGRVRSGFYGVPSQGVLLDNASGYKIGDEYNPFVKYPTTIAASSSATVQFRLHVPFAYNAVQDPLYGDLRGAIFSQTSIGNLPVVITMASSCFGSIYTGSLPSGVTESVTIQITQQWISPQPVNGQYPNPQLDLATVYEINGGIIDTSDLVASQDKFINVPNVREVLASYFIYDNNGTYNQGSDVNYFKLLVNGNNVMQYKTPTTLAYEDIDLAGVVYPPAVYVMRSRRVPLYTALQGNIQYVFNPSAFTSGGYLVEMFESFYTLGQQLPGPGPAS